ncbi:hypothetical protein G3N55_09215 [Dissulfurirhabdus thermomarina]|uniref:Uncharacterized protein n=1 Tax=Dissulfurirhabdus thermomarina TaxID=1765737 RepID=A0A6N9TPC6_DISTH|nr:hypothetical protein [Dissulfurirhabdus thermomarina]NDY43019.1 hypothetical protein [Dissulfurirhabdus thermomarina]NMX22887.1 hypothetical protein [Dissulfurirhabdus thermomarina]
MGRSASVLILWALLGGAAGYLLFHPYAMAVWRWTGGPAAFPGAFAAGMTAMALAFALLSAAVGFLAGLAALHRRRLLERRFEADLRREVLEVYRRLVGVLSHYFLNAALATEGAVRRLRRLPPGEAEEPLRVIEAHARQGEAVIRVLQDLPPEVFGAGDPGDPAALLAATREIEALVAAAADAAAGAERGGDP